MVLAAFVVGGLVIGYAASDTPGEESVAQGPVFSPLPGRADEPPRPKESPKTSQDPVRSPAPAPASPAPAPAAPVPPAPAPAVVLPASAPVEEPVEEQAPPVEEPAPVEVAPAAPEPSSAPSSAATVVWGGQCDQPVVTSLVLVTTGSGEQPGVMLDGRALTVSPARAGGWLVGPVKTDDATLQVDTGGSSSAVELKGSGSRVELATLVGQDVLDARACPPPVGALGLVDLPEDGPAADQVSAAVSKRSGHHLTITVLGPRRLLLTDPHGPNPSDRVALTAGSTTTNVTTAPVTTDALRSFIAAPVLPAPAPAVVPPAPAPVEEPVAAEKPAEEPAEEPAPVEVAPAAPEPPPAPSPAATVVRDGQPPVGALGLVDLPEDGPAADQVSAAVSKRSGHHLTITVLGPRRLLLTDPHGPNPSDRVALTAGSTTTNVTTAPVTTDALRSVTSS